MLYRAAMELCKSKKIRRHEDVSILSNSKLSRKCQVIDEKFNFYMGFGTAMESRHGTTRRPYKIGRLMTMTRNNRVATYSIISQSMNNFGREAFTQQLNSSGEFTHSPVSVYMFIVVPD